MTTRACTPYRLSCACICSSSLLSSGRAVRRLESATPDTSNVYVCICTSSREGCGSTMRVLVALMLVSAAFTLGFRPVPRVARVGTSVGSRRLEKAREQLDAPRPSVIAAVAAQKDKRLTASDAAALSGEELQVAQRSLMSLASFTGTYCGTALHISFTQPQSPLALPNGTPNTSSTPCTHRGRPGGE